MLGIISAAIKAPPMLAPDMIEEYIQDNQADEKIQFKSVQVDLSECK